MAMFVTRADRKYTRRPANITLDVSDGDITQSPCRSCPRHRAEFPGCLETCPVIDAFQRRLAQRVDTGKDGTGAYAAGMIHYDHRPGVWL